MTQVSDDLSQRERSIVRDEHPILPSREPPERKIPGLTTESWFQRHGEFTCAIISGILLLAATIWNWGQPAHDTPYHIMVGIAFALGFIFGSLEAWESLREGKLDIHFLMVIGAVAAIFVGSEFEGAVLLFLFTLSGSLENYAMQRTHAALSSLMKLFPKEAIVIGEDGQQRTVKLEELQIGDCVLVKPGENVAADGEVLEGASAVDESAITGEYLPCEKSVGNPVFAGTLNGAGRLVIRVAKPAHDTTLAKIIHLVSDAREEKAPVERLFDRIGTIYTVGVLLLSAGTMLVLHYFIGLSWVGPTGTPELGSVYRAITILIVASPCALIISTPVVLLSAIATCARRGIVLKGGRHLESIAALKAMVFDKTGTLTSGQVRMVDIEPVNVGWRGEELTNGQAATPETRLEMLRVAAALEASSTHPLAGAVLRAAKEAGITPGPVQDFMQEPGHGIRAMVDGKPAVLGSPQLIEGLCHTKAIEHLRQRIADAEQAGETAVVMYYGGRAALIRFCDTVRPEARGLVERLHNLGVRPLVMLTGDNKKAAEGIGHELGLDEVRAELLPEDKLHEVERLVTAHKYVGMVGDGINDAPALARATVGIAMGGIGSDAALQAADVVLLSDRIDRLAWLVEVSRRARRVMGQNLTFAIGVILVLVGWTLVKGVPLSLGVVGHEGSTVLVVLNGLRLLRAKE